ncbi:MAG: alpha/beta fold hydrolase [Candidatus Micrarchaeia archaeon]
MVESLGENNLITSSGKLFYTYYKSNNKNNINKNLVFLHGLGASSKAWNRVATILPTKYNFYFIDLLGHGRSDAPIVNYNIKLQVKTINEFINGLSLSNVYLIGHSYGGWIAATYAATYKSSLKGLVLVDSAGLDINFNSITPKESLALKEKMYYQIMKIDGNRSYVIKNILDSEFNEEWLTEEVLNEINVPTLIIWGENDKIINVKYAKIFNKRIKNSKLKIISSAGHNAHYTNSKEFVDLLFDFVENT